MSFKDLQAVYQAHPALTVQGLDYLRSDPAFSMSRMQLLTFADQFDLVVTWLQCNPKARTSEVNRLSNSYNWKHLAEKAVQAYIPNGVFIAAALHVGLVVEPIEDSLNAHFNLSQEFLQLHRVLLSACAC